MLPLNKKHSLLDPAIYEQEVSRFLRDFHFEGETSSLEHIRAIAQYYARLPYENVSKILKHAQHTDSTLFRLPDEVLDDHFTWHAGGTCFSLSYMLLGIYRILGYETQPLICNLNWGQNNHSALSITFSGSNYLVDPGYMIFKPLLLREQDVQSRISADTGLSLRFDTDSETYALYTYRNQQFVRRYQFRAEPVDLNTFAEHWRSSFELPGMNDITLTQVSGYEMLFIQGDFVKFTSPEEIKKFRDNDLTEKLILNRFGIPLEKVEDARYILSQRQEANES